MRGGDRDISTSEGQRPGQSTAVLRSVDDVYIKDARTVRPYRLGEYTTMQGEILWILLINMWRFAWALEDGGFYVEIIDI